MKKLLLFVILFAVGYVVVAVNPEKKSSVDLYGLLGDYDYTCYGYEWTGSAFDFDCTLVFDSVETAKRKNAWIYTLKRLERRIKSPYDTIFVVRGSIDWYDVYYCKVAGGDSIVVFPNKSFSTYLRFMPLVYDWDTLRLKDYYKTANLPGYINHESVYSSLDVLLESPQNGWELKEAEAIRIVLNGEDNPKVERVNMVNNRSNSKLNLCNDPKSFLVGWQELFYGHYESVDHKDYLQLLPDRHFVYNSEIRGRWVITNDSLLRLYFSEAGDSNMVYFKSADYGDSLIRVGCDSPSIFVPNKATPNESDSIELIKQFDEKVFIYTPESRYP